MNSIDQSKTIKIDNLSLELSGKKILDNLSFEFVAGMISCIIGPNGSGKTSMLRSLVGYYSISEQTKITYFGNAFGKNEEQIKKNLVYIPDEDTLELDLTGREFVEFISSFFSIEQISTKRSNDLIRLYDMEIAINDPISTYSHGMIKKLSLIAYLSISVDVIILDEPFNGLDPEYTNITSDLLFQLKKRGKLIIITSHNLSLIQKLADNLSVIIKGEQRYNGTLSNLLNEVKSDNLESSWLDIIGIRDKKESQINEYLESFSN